jgi:4-diphosphocytidyl-2-C-methyl-D-erythritol kinase
MALEINSPAKINLTLRITGSRKGGMHEIASLFMRLPALEKLTLRSLDEDNVKGDLIRVQGQEVKGRNILEMVLAVAREKEPRLPSFEVDIWKQVPSGSGLGSGSGNAAALASWLSREWSVAFSVEELAEIGSDVPFLFQGDDLSFMTGIGERPLRKIEDIAGLLRVVIVIPAWTCSTSAMYRMADEFYRERGWMLNEDEACGEALDILESLKRQERIGLLPNDFVPILEASHPWYRSFLDAAEAGEALAWGISGSGSAFFCLFGRDAPGLIPTELFEGMSIARKILILE